mmetsp:Transcript_103804/g.334700  ORF Transcript_103804/g.334700 Transcript_103804/m.334700 type:complete len:384 (-) Transcript_103804:164-1315(-)
MAVALSAVIPERKARYQARLVQLFFRLPAHHPAAAAVLLGLLCGRLPSPSSAPFLVLASEDAVLQAQAILVRVPAALKHIPRIPLDTAAMAAHWGWRLHRLDLRRSHPDDSTEGIMVAAALAKVGRAHDIALDVAENVVNAAEKVTAEDVVELSFQCLHRLRVHACIEVTHENNCIATLPVLSDDVQDVARSGPAAPSAAGIDGQGPMVVHEEHGPVGAEVLQAHPLRASLAVGLRPWLILRHVDHTLGQELPDSVPESHGDPVSTHYGRVVVKDASIGEHTPWVLAFLEAHDVVWRLGRGCNEVPGNAARPTAPAIQVPPVGVVRQDLHVHWLALRIRTPNCSVGGAACKPCGRSGLPGPLRTVPPTEQRHASARRESESQG